MAKILRLLSLCLVALFALSACAGNNNAAQTTDKDGDKPLSLEESLKTTQSVTFYDSYATW